MNLDALGYVGIRTRNLEDWASYGTRFLGMQLVDQSRGTLALRMDDRKQRIIVHTDEDDGPSFYGWDGRCRGARCARRASGKIRRQGGARLARTR